MKVNNEMIGFVKVKKLTTEEITQYRTARFNHILEDEKMIRKAQELIDKVAKRFGVNAEDVRNKKGYASNDNERKKDKNAILKLYSTWEEWI